MKLSRKVFKEIYEGYRNLIWPPEKIKEEIERVATERLAICTACPKNSGGQDTPITILSFCTECGCGLKAKTACLSCECPLKKWDRLLTKNQESKLKEQLSDGGTQH